MATQPLSKSSGSAEIIETESRIKIPVAVILERTIDSSKKWVFPSWSIAAVFTGENIQRQKEELAINETEDIVRTFHGGLLLELFKDGSEGYWYNLLSDEPYLFVICDGEQGAMQIEPALITANQDEATGHLESDDIVLSIQMPDEIRDLLERYVVDHYQPVVKKKRKRRDWLEDSLYANNESDSDQTMPAINGKTKAGDPA